MAGIGLSIGGAKVAQVGGPASAQVTGYPAVASPTGPMAALTTSVTPHAQVLRSPATVVAGLAALWLLWLTAHGLSYRG